ncbi:DUF1120 domain-containing protein [Salmonella enterica]|uniref:DUF1120 domain-containing protein n=1 Tax=Salmonella enterica TaxID=28901 RepID=A0A763AQE6_SALER|nr:hypothetical protein [Salmonella enterica subsp. enterica serovar Telelkebir]EAO6724714.1 DUF1120 domain-containing protein [Salmonella enterica]EBF9535223.1 DUF1120 domain-containing protein [Salmonella enterica subsp. enterica serovar Ank]EBZ5771035.1 DUF1120 domain-containing protein [Salmonella enterica subsp. enterica serovar Redlands]EDQ6396249.1 DUF1120 domain-containing protein [Salmonella enterica subsp. enterica serovar Olten]EDV4307858.1 DUF1120 domain-containing protein [Salmone
MKKLLIATSVVIGLSASAQAVESTAVLKLTGVLTNGACIPELSGGGVVDFGTKAVSDLLPTEDNQLGYQDFTLTIQCLSPTIVGWTVEDDRADSKAGVNITGDGTTYNGFTLNPTQTNMYGFGLGTTTGGINIGAYVMSADDKNALADGQPAKLLSGSTSYTVDSNWAVGSPLPMRPNYGYMYTIGSVRSETQYGQPDAITTAVFPLRVAAAVQGTNTLAITDNTTLDGQATFTLVYL